MLALGAFCGLMYVVAGVVLAIKFEMSPCTNREWWHPLPVFLWPLTLWIGLWDIWRSRRVERQRSRKDK